MKIRIGFFAVMLGLSLVLTHSHFALAAFLAALLHEFGHILAARLCGIPLYECKIGLFGAGLFPEEALFSYGREIILCAAGPLTNLLFALLGLLYISGNPSAFLEYFVFSSFAFGLLNLLPIRDFDGGRVLQALLALRFSPTTVERTIWLLSFFCILFLWSISVYLLLRASSSLSLFVFSLSLFCRIFIRDS